MTEYVAKGLEQIVLKGLIHSSLKLQLLLKVPALLIFIRGLTLETSLSVIDASNYFKVANLYLYFKMPQLRFVSFGTWITSYQCLPSKS